MVLLSLLLAIAPAAQVDPVPELVVPGRYGAPVVSPDGRHVLLLDGRRAWLLDPQTLQVRVGGNLVRGDEYAASLGNREAGKR
jgi:hypothetical protein